jgi:hypothetical protein
MRPLDRLVQPGRAVTAVLLVLLVFLLPASCASVTSASRLESEAGGNWITESVGAEIVVEPTGGVRTTGRLLGAKAEVVHLQEKGLAPVAIPVAPGANLRETRRGTGAWQGALAGAGLGVALGLVLAQSLGSPNPDSAGGVERPPAVVVIPVSALAGSALGALFGVAAGAERRLELRAAPTP